MFMRKVHRVVVRDDDKGLLAVLISQDKWDKMKTVVEFWIDGWNPGIKSWTILG